MLGSKRSARCRRVQRTYEQRACLTGAWLNDVLNADEPAAGQLSPFDLDESIQTFSTSDDLLRNPGLVFDTIDNLRIGTIDGLDECGL